MLLRTLGGLSLEGSAFRRRKPLLLLTFLALEGPTSRRALAERFFPESRDPRDLLSTTLRRLKDVLEDGLSFDGERVTTSVPCDAVQFLLRLNDGNREEALGLYGGPFLHALDLSLGEELEEWVFGLRERLAERARSGHLEVAEHALVVGNEGAARRHAECAAALLGTREVAAADVARLRHVLRVSGSDRVTELEASAAALGIVVPPEPPENEALGLADALPTRGIPSNLPPPTTSFVGRGNELRLIAEHLNAPHGRLLTLHGPGGVGKTRLALEAAWQAVDDGEFPDGVFFVPLDASASSDAMLVGIADVLRLMLQPFVPPFVQVRNRIGSRHMLVVLDNFEQLTSAAVMLAELIRGCPNARFLVTSRVRLNLVEEHVLRVEGLPVREAAGAAVPSGSEVGEAVALFVQRAKRMDLRHAFSPEDLATAERICDAVQGLPLAIELSASWLRVMPLEEVAREVASSVTGLASPHVNIPERHETLSTVFEHSWRLLDERDRAALRRLAVFRGGFTRVAAHAVASVDLDGLARLADHSLLRMDERGRFDRHPLIYEFTERLLRSDEAEEREYRSRHAEFFLELALRHETHLLGGRELGGAIGLLDVELANLEAAWSWLLSTRRLGDLERMAWPLLLFCELRGRFAEGLALYGRALQELDREQNEEPVGERRASACAQAMRSYLLFRKGDAQGALDAGLEAERSLEGSAEEPYGVARFVALTGAGDGALVLGRVREAEAITRRALGLMEATRAGAATELEVKRSEGLLGVSHEILGMIKTHEGDFEEAKEHLLRGLELHARHEAPFICHDLWNLGQLSNLMGEHEDAVRWLEQGLGIASMIGFASLEAFLSVELARATFALDQTGRTSELCRKTIGIADELGMMEPAVAANAILGHVRARERAFREALRAYERSVRAAIALASAGQAMEALLGAAEALVHLGEGTRASETLEFVIRNAATPERIRTRAVSVAENERYDTGTWQRTFGTPYPEAAAVRAGEGALEDIAARVFRGNGVRQ